MTAKSEYGVSDEFIVKGIRSGHPEYRDGAIWGNPCPVQDNVSHDKKPEACEWFSANRSRVEAVLLPAYSPEFNAVERVWHYTRIETTPNVYFDTPAELCRSLLSTFDKIQR